MVVSVGWTSLQAVHKAVKEEEADEEEEEIDEDFDNKFDYWVLVDWNFSNEEADGEYDDDVCFGDNVMNTQWARNLFLVKIPKI